MKRRAAATFVLVLAGFLFGACEKSAAEAGGERFRQNKGYTESNLNRTSCATCHEVGPDEDTEGYRKPAYGLDGVVARERWWGGSELHLLDAVNQCVVWFMRGDALDPDSDPAKQLYEYLESITPDGASSDILPMTIVENIAPLPLGDAARGQALYDLHCQFCHGDLHTGSGNHGISDFILPESTSDYDEFFPGVPKGLIVIEKTRHGRFFNVGGVMPFYSLERLSDDEISDILALLELPAE
jgi:thiosulfate dehydrogenase